MVCHLFLFDSLYVVKLCNFVVSVIMTYMHQDAVVDKYDNIRPQSFPNTLLFSLSVLCYLSRNIEEKEKHVCFFLIKYKAW